MEPADFSKAGKGLIGLVITMAFVNMGLMTWGICETLYDAMASRESTMIGRLLRFWFKVKLAEPPECSCECCTCAEDRRKGFLSPQYERQSWFEIIPSPCEADEIEEDTETPAIRYAQRKARGEMTPAEQLLAADVATQRDGDLEKQSDDSDISQIKHYKSRREERLARKAKNQAKTRDDDLDTPIPIQVVDEILQDMDDDDEALSGLSSYTGKVAQSLKSKVSKKNMALSVAPPTNTIVNVIEQPNSTWNDMNPIPDENELPEL